MNPAFVYDIHFPEQLEEQKKYPVIFTLHGKGSNERDLYSLVEPLANHFIIISIRGNLAFGPGYQFYELKSLGNPVREMFDNAIANLESFIQYATDKYPINPECRYMLGFSQGAILSMSLALKLGNQLKGIVALSGYVPDFVKNEYPLQSVEDMSVFISHGELDSVFPIAIGHQTADYFKDKTKHLTFTTYRMDHGVSRENYEDIVKWFDHELAGEDMG